MEKRKELRVGRNERTLCKEGATGILNSIDRQAQIDFLTDRERPKIRWHSGGNSGARAGRCCAGIGRPGAQGSAPTRRHSKDSRAFGFDRPEQNIFRSDSIALGMTLKLPSAVSPGPRPIASAKVPR